ncbi:hypothetical protein C4577_03640 [Candidatus Parcubacteria bacterium]|nr:MAG: hypothetical protein C4577_03640 [Candidatus Parcubacteria bacterium]
MSESMLASDLFAKSQGSVNNGIQNCHWCSAACDMTWRHDDPPPIPFLKNKNLARCPANSFMCVGCWLWRRSRVTVFFLDNSYKDSQTAANHSWWITDSDAKVITPDCQKLLQATLLKPPNRFVLSLKTDPVIPNHLHLAIANDVSIIEANTPLMFSFNNIVSEYTVYDLETALKDKDAVRTPGVRLLLSYFTPWEYPAMDKKRTAGKPPEIQLSATTKKIITTSGNTAQT